MDVLFKKAMSNPGMISTELYSPLRELEFNYDWLLNWSGCNTAVTSLRKCRIG